MTGNATDRSNDVKMSSSELSYDQIPSSAPYILKVDDNKELFRRILNVFLNRFQFQLPEILSN